MKLNEFVASFFGALEAQGIRFCILRNYEGLPQSNIGRDIDVLIADQDADTAFDILKSVCRVRITGYIKRSYVRAIFIEGVELSDQRALEIDLVTRFAWKGLDYIDVDDVLASTLVPLGKPSYIRVPQSVHEAIISFFSSFLLCGFIKERYADQVRGTFAAHRDTIAQLLTSRFGKYEVGRLISCIIQRDDPGALALLPILKRNLIRNAVRKNLLGSALDVSRHIIMEISVRYSSRTRYRICLLGPDGAGKSTLLEEATPILASLCSELQVKHLKPTLFGRSRIAARGVVTEPHKLPNRGVLCSTIKIFTWLLEARVSALLSPSKSFTIEIYDRYFFDILVDPRRYRYGGSMQAARLVSSLIPAPDLIVILDAPAEVVQKRKQEVSRAETERQLMEYRALAKSLRNAALVDASQPINIITEEFVDLAVHSMSRRCL
jgi:thymidylate kinase